MPEHPETSIVILKNTKLQHRQLLNLSSYCIYGSKQTPPRSPRFVSAGILHLNGGGLCGGELEVGRLGIVSFFLDSEHMFSAFLKMSYTGRPTLVLSGAASLPLMISGN